jgi:hypothetical protein
VHGIGDQRQRVGRIAEHQLGHDEGRVERRAERKRGPEIVGRVAMSGMAMPVRMAGMMVGMIHGASRQ